MPNLYIISGPNGAGKTTASFTVLPEMLDCDEFVNADEIARGLSPLNPDKAAIDAGRIMLAKINYLISKKADFAFETTLASKRFVKTIQKAKSAGYQVTLLYFWLESVELAIERVRIRVEEGGHDIPENVIQRRYFSGLKNLFELYMNICDSWIIVDNSSTKSLKVADRKSDQKIKVVNSAKFAKIQNQLNDSKRGKYRIR